MLILCVAAAHVVRTQEVQFTMNRPPKTADVQDWRTALHGTLQKWKYQQSSTTTHLIDKGDLDNPLPARTLALPINLHIP